MKLCNTIGMYSNVFPTWKQGMRWVRVLFSRYKIQVVSSMQVLDEGAYNPFSAMVRAGAEFQSPDLKSYLLNPQLPSELQKIKLLVLNSCNTNIWDFRSFTSFQVSGLISVHGCHGISERKPFSLSLCFLTYKMYITVSPLCFKWHYKRTASLFKWEESLRCLK